MDDLFEDTIKELRALSAYLQRRAQKVDEAIGIMLGEDRRTAPPRMGYRQEAVNTHTIVPTKGIAVHTIEMMAFLMHMGGAHLDAIRAYLGTRGQGKDVTLRSQLSSFVNKGWLVRVHRGFYRVTPLGATKCGLKYAGRCG